MSDSLSALLWSRQRIQSSTFWELENDLRAVYRGERSEPDLPDRVFAFAAWCFQAQQNWHLRNAAAVGFYEHLPNVEAGRRDLAERLSKEALTELRPLFFQILPQPIYEAMSLEIERVHGERLL